MAGQRPPRRTPNRGYEGGAWECASASNLVSATYPRKLQNIGPRRLTTLRECGHRPPTAHASGTDRPLSLLVRIDRWRSRNGLCSGAARRAADLPQRYGVAPAANSTWVAWTTMRYLAGTRQVPLNPLRSGSAGLGRSTGRIRTAETCRVRVVGVSFASTSESGEFHHPHPHLSPECHSQKRPIVTTRSSATAASGGNPNLLSTTSS